MADDLFRDLNPAQKEAVECIRGHLLVLAGAGSGKTRVITCRIVNILRKGHLTSGVVGLTFTNKAAKEMRDRVRSIIGDSAADRITLGTFHSFCLAILKKHPEEAGIPEKFGIADDGDQSSYMRQALAEIGHSDLDADAMRWTVARWKNNAVFPEAAIAAAASSQIEAIAAAAYARYQGILADNGMIDFDDMLMLVIRLWQRHPDNLAAHKERHTHILVDEFQDTNHAQLQLLEMLAGPNGNLCVVGDDDQSIYGWRGAHVENILGFPSRFQGAKVIKLEQNYRSTNTILKAANAFIAGNARRHAKTLWSARGDGRRIRIVEKEGEEAEAQYAADMVRDTLANDRKIKPSDFAILYRSNHQSRLYEVVFRRAKIPYRLVGGSSFYDRREIRDAVAYLKTIHNPLDDQSLLRALASPPRGVGGKSVEALHQLRKRLGKPMSAILGHPDFHSVLTRPALHAATEFKACLDHTRIQFATAGALAAKAKVYFKDSGFLDSFQRMYKNYDEAVARRDYVMEFINSMALHEENAGSPVMLGDFLETVALSNDIAKSDKKEKADEDAVTFTTVHAAKGLEFKYVLVCGMEQGIFPHRRSIDTGDVEEERRLFYVAITRAKDMLYLARSKRRVVGGSSRAQTPSAFLGELPSELVETDADAKPVTVDDMQAVFAKWRTQFKTEDSPA